MDSKFDSQRRGIEDLYARPKIMEELKPKVQGGLYVGGGGGGERGCNYRILR